MEKMAALARVNEGYDPGLLIKQWQQSATDNTGPDDRSIAARLCADIIVLFKGIIRNMDGPQEIRIRFERSCHSMILWNEDGMSEGKLDGILATSTIVRRPTLTFVTSIGRTLTERLLPLVNPSPKLTKSSQRVQTLTEEASYVLHDDAEERSDDPSSDESSIFEADDLEEIAEDLKTDIQCLMDLGPLFKCPVLDVEQEREPAAGGKMSTTWSPHKNYCDRISQRFPKAHGDLVLRLGKANWDRFLRCRERRNRSNQEAKHPVLEASTVDGSKFHDSGLGTSVPSGGAASIRYAETTMSFHAENGSSVRIPPLSHDAKRGNPFECVACGKRI